MIGEMMDKNPDSPEHDQGHDSFKKQEHQRENNFTSHEQKHDTGSFVDKPKRRGFLNRTGVYGLELAVAMVTFLIMNFVLTVGIFALCQYVYGSVTEGMGNFALWSAASALVWLPVLYIFYRRSSAYMETHPNIVDNSVQRAFVMIYQVLMILVAITFMGIAIYTTLSKIVEGKDIVESLVTVSLPCLLAALLHGGAFVAFFKRPVIDRKLFANVTLVVSLAIIIAVIAFSMVMLRGINTDARKSRDIAQIVQDINSNTREGVLPNSLSDLNNASELEGDLEDYKYNRKSDTTYEICTDFMTNTKDKEKSRFTSNYYTHDKGEVCFPESAVSTSLYYNYDNDYNSDGSY